MAEPYKNYFGKQLAQKLAGAIAAVWPEFPGRRFVSRVTREVEPLELKARVAVISQALNDSLPPKYAQALDILSQAWGPPNPNEMGIFEHGYWLMPVAHWVETNGLEYPDASLKALREITMRFTSEWAIRPYLERYPEKTLSYLERWVKDPNLHVRRLVSEGPRPRLPWGRYLRLADPHRATALQLLTRLNDDPSLYVRRSVANHVNDLSKESPDLVRDLLDTWSHNGSPRTAWIIRHASRTLRKRDGHAPVR
jgi:3-methyladenine DNA glycosylase AlkC